MFEQLKGSDPASLLDDWFLMRSRAELRNFDPEVDCQEFKDGRAMISRGMTLDEWIDGLLLKIKRKTGSFRSAYQILRFLAPNLEPHTRERLTCVLPDNQAVLIARKYAGLPWTEAEGKHLAKACRNRRGDNEKLYAEILEKLNG